MNTSPKPRGGTDSQLTKLKQLPPENHEVIWSWRDENPPLTNAQIRNRLATTFQVRLKLDKQLSQFWSWYAAQRALSDTNDLIETFEEFTRSQHPDWSPEKVRQTGIAFFMANSVAQKDADKFATIVTLDQRERFGKTKASLDERRLAFEQNKFSESLRTKLESAFNELAIACKGNAVAEEHIRKARELIAPEK